MTLIVNRCSTDSLLIFHRQLTLPVLAEGRPVYLPCIGQHVDLQLSVGRYTSCDIGEVLDQHMDWHVDRQSTDMAIESPWTYEPIVSTDTWSRGAQITQDISNSSGMGYQLPAYH